MLQAVEEGGREGGRGGDGRRTPAGAPPLKHPDANALRQATIKRNNSPCLPPGQAGLGRGGWSQRWAEPEGRCELPSLIGLGDS